MLALLLSCNDNDVDIEYYGPKNTVTLYLSNDTLEYLIDVQSGSMTLANVGSYHQYVGAVEPSTDPMVAKEPRLFIQDIGRSFAFHLYGYGNFPFPTGVFNNTTQTVDPGYHDYSHIHFNTPSQIYTYFDDGDFVQIDILEIGNEMSPPHDLDGNPVYGHWNEINTLKASFSALMQNCYSCPKDIPVTGSIHISID